MTILLMLTVFTDVRKLTLFVGVVQVCDSR